MSNWVNDGLLKMLLVLFWERSHHWCHKLIPVKVDKIIIKYNTGETIRSIKDVS